MLSGTIGELVIRAEEVWTLDKTSIIFDVKLSRMVLVELAMEAEQKT